MKKVLFLVLAFVLLIPVVSYAASISGAETILSGSTDKPSYFSLKRLSIGVDNDYVFGRDLKVGSYTKDYYVNAIFLVGGVPADQILFTQNTQAYILIPK